jgi:filamentous hemagglutinin family protein
MKIQPLIPLLTTIWVGLATTVTFAQTVPASTRIPVVDNTLGTQVTGGNNSTITGGLQRGQNLFHSFQDFSVPTGGSATFFNPVGNQSIVTRVTGNLFSDIDGIVNSQGANFFLINPNGIVFGANAQLNVGQTFVGSTANGIDFKDAGGNSYRFGINGNDAPLLTINPNAVLTPAKLILGGGNGEIKTLGTLATINLDQYIGLIGGNVTIDQAQIIAPGGRVEIGGLSAAGAVELGGNGNSFRVNYPPNIARSDVSITNGSTIVVIDVKGGDIDLNARNITISGDSGLYGGIYPSLGIIPTSAGRIALNATGEVVVADSTIGNVVFPLSIGNGGNITIDAASISLDGASIAASTLGNGNAGNVTLTATNAISLDGFNNLDRPTTIASNVVAGAEGDAGNINLRGGSILFQDGAFIATATQGKGNAGNVTLIAKDSISLQGFSPFIGNFSAITTNVFPGAEGRGGNIDLVAGGSISLQDGALISAGTGGKGSAGNVTLTAKDTVSLSGANSLFQAPSLIATNVLSPAEGNGGDITVNAGSISLQDGGAFAASTEGNGNAGNVIVTAKDAIYITGKYAIDDFASGLYVESTSNTGTAGDIVVRSPRITVDNGGIINSQSNLGNGGNINIAGTSSGAANLLILRRGAQISTSSAGTLQQGGNGGNISVNIPNGFIVTAPNENSDITANAFGGSGGKVTINSQQNFWISPVSRAELARNLGTNNPNQLNPANLSSNNITAISQVNPNLSGQVNITRPGIDIAAGLTPLPNNVVDPTDRINPNCSPKSLGNNSFTNVGRGGIPPSPKDPLNEEKIAVNWVRLNPTDMVPANPIDTNIAHLPKPVVEAQGWMRDRNGDIILVAQSRSGTMIYPSQSASGCMEK